MELPHMGAVAASGTNCRMYSTACVPASSSVSDDRSISSRSPDFVCILRTKSSISAITSGGWCTTRSSPSASISRWASVTSTATSTIRWRSTSRPVISRSIHTRRSSALAGASATGSRYRSLRHDERAERQVHGPQWTSRRAATAPRQRLRRLARRAHPQPRLARAMGAARRARQPRSRHRPRGVPGALRRLGTPASLRHRVRVRAVPPWRVAHRRGEPRQRPARPVPVGVRRILDRRLARGTEPDPRGCRGHPALRVRGVAPAPHRGRHRPTQRAEPARGAEARPARRGAGGAISPDPRRLGGPRPLRDDVRGVGRAPRRDHEAVSHLSHAPPRRRARSFSTEDAYGLLLGIIVLTFVLLSQVDPARWTRLVIAPSLGAMLLLALYASRARRQLMRVAIIGLAVAFVIVLLEAVTDRNTFAGSTYAIYGLLIAITPMVIINRILRHPEVQVSTILGAICAYMLIGMVFAFVYAMIGRIDPPFFADRGPVDQFDFFYFSYQSLTTLGYGDFVSRGDLGRSLSVLEAVTGQLFLVTLIARLVSLFKPPQRDAGSTRPE